MKTTTQIILLTLIFILRAAPPVSAGNTVSVATYVPVIGNSNGTTNTGVAYESCSAVNGADFAEVSAYAFYGSNQIVAACSIIPESDFNGDSYAFGSSEWSDTLVINAPSSIRSARFRFNFHGGSEGSAGVGGWAISSSAGPNYSDIFQDGIIDYPFYFTNGIPFSMDVFMEGGASAYSGSVNAGITLTSIPLTDGASISSLSGINWLTNVTIIRPSLSILQSGTNVVLHWFAFDATNFTVETTTDISDPTAWRQLTNSDDPSPVQIGNTEFTLNYPVDSTARFFRLIEQ